MKIFFETQETHKAGTLHLANPNKSMTITTLVTETGTG